MENRKNYTKMQIKINDVKISYVERQGTYTSFSIGIKRYDKKNPDAKIYDNFKCFIKGEADIENGDTLDITGILSIGEYNGKPSFSISVSEFQKKGNTASISPDDLPF